MSSVNNKKDLLYTQAYDTLSWLGESAVSLVTNAVSKSAQVAVKVLEFGESDIDPETLERYRSGKMSRCPIPSTSPKPSCLRSKTVNLIPVLIEQRWLTESDRCLSADSGTNQIALCMFKTKDGWKIPHRYCEGHSVKIPLKKKVGFEIPAAQAAI